MGQYFAAIMEYACYCCGLPVAGSDDQQFSPSTGGAGVSSYMEASPRVGAAMPMWSHGTTGGMAGGLMDADGDLAQIVSKEMQRRQRRCVLMLPFATTLQNSLIENCCLSYHSWPL